MPRSGKQAKPGQLIRTCGAEAERPPAEASQCWCRGMFCGRGGIARTKEWRLDTGCDAALVSRGEAELFLRQPDLFDGEAIREKWRARFDGRIHEVPARVDA